MDILLVIPIHKKKKSILSIFNIIKPKISNNKLNNFIELLETNNFKVVNLKIKKNYTLYQHKLIKMFYIRVYNAKYAVYPICNSDHFLYKEEQLSDVTFDKDNFLVDLLKEIK